MQILEAPTWVYVLFVFLLILGIKALQPKTVTFRRLLVLPAIFTIWNLSWLFSHLENKYSFFALWFIGLVLGGVIGWQTVRSWKVQANHKKKTISLPGSPSTLIIILIVFAIRYFFGYMEAVDPNPSLTFLDINAGVSGVLTGIFIGRAIELYRKYAYARG